MNPLVHRDARVTFADSPKSQISVNMKSPENRRQLACKFQFCVSLIRTKGRPVWTIAVAIVAWALSCGAAEAADPILPDPKLTPGAVLTTDAATICQPG
jgi:hypothetical protein